MSEENKEKQKVNVTLDTRETERLARESERLKMQLEKEGKTPDTGNFNLAEKKLEMFEQTGNKLYLDCKTREEIKNLTTSLMREVTKHGTPSGSPLVNQQYGVKNEGLFSRKFDSEKEMVDTILEYMHSEDLSKASEGKEAYEAFLKKWIMDKRQNPTRPEPSYSPNSPEALLDLGLESKDGFLSPKDKNSGDLGKLQALWRAKRKKMMEGKSE